MLYVYGSQKIVMEAKCKKYFLILLFPLLAALSLNAENYITTRDVKFRAEKSPRAHVIGSIKKNTVVDVTEIDDEWWKITYNGREGYVQSKFLKTAPAAAVVHTSSPVAEPSGLPFGLNTDSIVAFLISVLIIVVIVRQIRNYIAYRKARATYVPEVVKKAAITHWYQCKHCRVAIKKDSEPGIAGCSESLRHLWVNLGEIGDIKYICKGCSTIITVKAEPLIEGCPNDGDHVWKKI